MKAIPFLVPAFVCFWGVVCIVLAALVNPALLPWIVMICAGLMVLLIGAAFVGWVTKE